MVLSYLALKCKECRHKDVLVEADSEGALYFSCMGCDPVVVFLHLTEDQRDVLEKKFDLVLEEDIV